MLYLFRKVYAEVGSALPLNGGTYTVLLNTTNKRVAAGAAVLFVGATGFAAAEEPEFTDAFICPVLGGEAGALRDFTLINAAAGLVAADLADDITAGLKLAAGSIDSGAALEKLESWVKVSNEVG